SRAFAHAHGRDRRTMGTTKLTPPGPSGPRHLSSRRLLLVFGIATAILIGIGIPAGQLVLSLLHRADFLQGEVRMLALAGASRAGLEPGTWRGDEYSLAGVLRSGHDSKEEWYARVIDLDGRVLADTGMQPAGFTMTRAAPAEVAPDET